MESAPLRIWFEARVGGWLNEKGSKGGSETKQTKHVERGGRSYKKKAVN